MGLVTLLTDFGTRDPYVGVMKGVMLGIHPGVRLVDLTHEVDPQDVRQGAFQLAVAAEWFPAGTVHLAVVDPGVGSGRRALVARGERHLYVGPDNGLLSLAWVRDPPVACWEIRPGPWTLPTVSRTFHGRDVFAPVAAYLAAGVDPGSFGPPVGDPVRLERPLHEVGEGAVDTAVLHVDGFGNLVTALHASELTGRSVLAVEAAGRRVPVGGTYAEADAGSPLALWGSSGFLEIAVRGGDAARALGVGVGAPVRVLLGP